MKLEKEQ